MKDLFFPGSLGKYCSRRLLYYHVWSSRQPCPLFFLLRRDETFARDGNCVIKSRFRDWCEIHAEDFCKFPATLSFTNVAGWCWYSKASCSATGLLKSRVEVFWRAQDMYLSCMKLFKGFCNTSNRFGAHIVGSISRQKPQLIIDSNPLIHKNTLHRQILSKKYIFNYSELFSMNFFSFCPQSWICFLLWACHLKCTF